jgi:hypothetical protein
MDKSRKIKLALAAAMLVVAVAIGASRLGGGGPPVEDEVLKKDERIQSELQDYGPPTTEAPPPAQPPAKTPAKATNRGPQSPGG